MQYEAASAQVPLWHRSEQHWPLSVQGFPAVLQAGLRLTQVFPGPQLPLQQPDDDVQAALSAKQVVPPLAQRPFWQDKLQQSVAN